MPRVSSHFSKGGTTTARLERRGRERTPMVWKDFPGCMCACDSTPWTFCVRGENTPDYPRLLTGGSAERRDIRDRRLQPFCGLPKSLSCEVVYPPRYRLTRFLRVAIRIAA